MKDFYQVLGVPPSASPEAIRRAYRDRAQAAMWDRPRFAALSEAFETLKDARRRAEYDARRLSQLGDAENLVDGGEDAAHLSSAQDQGATAMGEAQSTIRMGAAGAPTAAPTGAVRGRGEQTQVVALPPCPVCQTPGVVGEQFCVECGFLVGSLPGAAAAQRPLPHLVDAAGREYVLQAGANTVGREGADVMLPDRTVSRRHALIMVEESGDVWMEDTGSTNGTQRANQPLPAGQRAALADGTQLQFGAVKLTIAIPDAPLALPETAGGGEPIAALPMPEHVEPVEPAEEAEPIAKLVGKNGQVYALTETVTTFGRRPTNHFVLNGDPYVSGAHAQIVFENDRFFVVDMGSTNGTRMHGVKLAPNTPAPIADGEEVILGQTPLRFYTRLGGEEEGEVPDPDAAAAEATP